MKQKNNIIKNLQIRVNIQKKNKKYPRPRPMKKQRPQLT